MSSSLIDSSKRMPPVRAAFFVSGPSAPPPLRPSAPPQRPQRPPCSGRSGRFGHLRRPNTGTLHAVARRTARAGSLRPLDCRNISLLLLLERTGATPSTQQPGPEETAHERSQTDTFPRHGAAAAPCHCGAVQRRDRGAGTPHGPGTCGRGGAHLPRRALEAPHPSGRVRGGRSGGTGLAAPREAGNGHVHRHGGGHARARHRGTGRGVDLL